VDSVLAAAIEQKQILVGQQHVSIQMHIVDVQHTTTVKCMLCLTIQVGQQHLDIAIVTYKKYTKVLLLLLEALVRKVLDSAGFVAVILVYHTEQADKVQ
jgi:hypothetical protein